MNMKEETQTGLGGAAELTSVTFSVYLEGDLVLFSSPDLQTRVVSSQLPEPLSVHGEESSCHHRRPEEEEEPDKNENELHQRSPRGQRSQSQAHWKGRLGSSCCSSAGIGILL